MSRLLKAKYFVHHSFLESSVKHNSSYIWRSICDSKDVLVAGLGWRVGTGKKIWIWKDPWLMSSTTTRILSPLKYLDEHATVGSLINRSKCFGIQL